MEKHSIIWSWTQPYTAWQPMPTRPQDEVIEQKLQTQDFTEAQAVLKRIMAL